MLPWAWRLPSQLFFFPSQIQRWYWQRWVWYCIVKYIILGKSEEITETVCLLTSARLYFFLGEKEIPCDSWSFSVAEQRKWGWNMPLTTACGQLKPNILSQCECELDCRFKANKMPQEQIAIVFSIGCTGDGEIKVWQWRQLSVSSHLPHLWVATKENIGRCPEDYEIFSLFSPFFVSFNQINILIE